MSDETVTVEVELPRTTHERLATDGDPSETLTRLAEDERRMREAIAAAGRDPPTSDSPDGDRAMHAPPIGVLLGLELGRVGDGEAVIELDAGPRHANPMGTLHGGVLCDLGDLAMGAANASTLGEGESFTTLELDVKFLRPVWESRLTATATVMKDGRTVSLVGCDITDEDGSQVARLESVCLTLRGDDAAGR